MNIDDIIKERAATHGPFNIQAEIAQKLKEVLRAYPGYAKLSFVHREALDMVMHKASRIACGNPDERDHALDMAGYSKLIVDYLDDKRNS